MTIKKITGNMLTTLAIITLLTGMNNAYAMQKPKRKARCVSEKSQLDSNAGAFEYQKPERQKLKLQELEELESKQPEDGGQDPLESEQLEDGEQDPMDSVYINNPSMAEQMEDAELFARNGAILNAEFEQIIQQERIAKRQAERARVVESYAQVQAYVQQQQALAQKAYLRVLAPQAPLQQRKTRMMQAATYECQYCTYINKATAAYCVRCDEPR